MYFYQAALSVKVCVAFVCLYVVCRLSFVLCTEISAYLLTENVYGQRSEHGVSAVWTPGLL